jgi:tetratricopeptide (TPR) repeat protein
MNQCKYHPLDAATWHDRRSGRFLCERCVELVQTEEPGAIDLISKRELEPLSGRAGMPAFWEILPEVFAYPSHLNGLASVGLCVLLGMVATLPGTGFALAVLPVALFLLAGYGEMAMRAVADGDTVPPQPLAAIQMNLKNGSGLFVILALALGIPLGVGYLGWPWLAGFLFFMINLVFPAAVVNLMVHHEVGSALSFQQWQWVVKQIGGEYLMLVLFTLAVSLVGAWLYQMLANEVPLPVLVGVCVAALGWLLLAACFVMGYSLRRMQRELGYETREQRTRQRRTQAMDVEDNRLMMMVRRGLFDEARQFLIKSVKKNANDLRRHDQLHRLLMEMKDTDAVFDHAEVYLAALQRDGDDARLAYLYKQLHEIRPEYLPDEPAVRHALAVQAQVRGQHRECLTLLSRLHERYPNYIDIPGAYLIAARSFQTMPEQHLQAVALLKYIQHKYPDYRQQKQVAQLLSELEKTGAQPDGNL